MRVVHVAPTPFGSTGMLGGGERYPLELARALARDVDCELITFGPYNSCYREPSGLQVRTLAAAFYLHGHPAHPVSLGLAGALAGARIVHTHHMRSAPSRVAALAARCLGRQAVTTDHGVQGSDWGGLLPRLFDRFLLVSEHSARQLGVPPSRVRVILGGADPVRFGPHPAATRRGVLFVGRITPHKGIDRLIEAMPDGTRLRVVGSCGHDPRLPERDYPQLLRRLARDRDVEFVGPVDDAALPEIYRQARVLALPSVYRTCYGRAVKVSELLGLVAIEAMASGTPVVCSRLGGLPEVVQDRVTGFLVEPGDVRALRERLSELARDPGLVTRLGRNARDLVLERFTWRACADRCLAAYDELQRSTGG